MIQTAGQQQSEATVFFIILVIALLVLYVYYGWVKPIRNLRDKTKPKTPSVIALMIAIVVLIFIAWLIVDEIRRVFGLKAAAPAVPTPEMDTSAAEAFKGTFQPKGVVIGVPPSQ